MRPNKAEIGDPQKSVQSTNIPTSLFPEKHTSIKRAGPPSSVVFAEHRTFQITSATLASSKPAYKVHV